MQRPKCRRFAGSRNPADYTMRTDALVLTAALLFEYGASFNSARFARVQRCSVITRKQSLVDARLRGSRDARGLWPVDEEEEPWSVNVQQTTQAQEMFRHRFIIGKDFLIRTPLDASSLFRSCTMHSHLSTCIELQLEAFRPIERVQWSPDARRMLTLPNAGGSSLVSEALAFEVQSRQNANPLESGHSLISLWPEAPSLQSPPI